MSVRVVLYHKYRERGLKRVCDMSHVDVEEAEAMATAFQLLGVAGREGITGADTYEIGAVRIAARAAGDRMVEIAESTSYDPYEWDGKKINGWAYRRKRVRD